MGCAKQLLRLMLVSYIPLFLRHANHISRPRAVSDDFLELIEVLLRHVQSIIYLSIAVEWI